MTAESGTEKNDARHLGNKEQNVRSWNHDGFVSRMSERLEKVRLLLRGDVENSSPRSGRENVRA